MNDYNFENVQNQFFNDWKKLTKWFDHERWTKEMKKVRAHLYLK